MRDTEEDGDLKRHLESFLKSTPGISAEALRKNRIQDCIGSLFKKTGSYALPSPSSEAKDTASLGWSDLTPEFQNSFNKFMAALQPQIG